MKFYISPEFFTFYDYVTNSQSHQLAPRLLDGLVGRALHRYRRGHGLRSGINFFQALISQLLKFYV